MGRWRGPCHLTALSRMLMIFVDFSQTPDLPHTAENVPHCPWFPTMALCPGYRLRATIRRSFGHRILAGHPIILDSGERGLVVNDKRTKNSGVMIVAFAAVAAWQIYDMATATETPSRTLAVLQYVLLAGLLLGFIGAVLNFLRSQ